MKKYLFTSICTLCFYTLSLAQNGLASFSSLQTPTSPGFILLDRAPASIERPTSPQGFAISMLNISQGGAMEIAPYWLKIHPDLTSETMTKNKFPLLYTLSFSAANVNLDSGKYLTAGLRGRIFQVYSKKQIKNIDDKRNAMIAELSKGDSTNWNKVEVLKSDYADLTLKPTFTIDFAVALAGSSKTSTIDTIAIARKAAWLTFNFRPKGDDFYFTVLGRYINNVKFEEQSKNTDLVDIGARLNYDINKLTISLEYLQRFNLTNKDYANNRLAFVSSYQVNENIYLTGTFGKNFENNNNLITMVGVNFGFSSAKLKAF